MSVGSGVGRGSRCSINSLCQYLRCRCHAGQVDKAFQLLPRVAEIALLQLKFRHGQIATRIVRIETAGPCQAVACLLSLAELPLALPKVGE